MFVGLSDGIRGTILRRRAPIFPIAAWPSPRRAAALKPCSGIPQLLSTRDTRTSEGSPMAFSRVRVTLGVGALFVVSFLVVALFGVTSRSNQADRSGATLATVETGIVFLYGHRIQPPYEFVISENKLLLNSIQIVPRLHLSPARTVDELPRDVMERIERREALTGAALDASQRASGAGGSFAVMCSEYAGVLRADTVMVDSVSTTSHGVLVYWKGDGREEIVLDHAHTSPGQDVAPSQSDVAQATAETFVRQLRSGFMILLFEAGWTSVQPHSVPEYLEEIDRLQKNGYDSGQKGRLLPSDAKVIASPPQLPQTREESQ